MCLFACTSSHSEAARSSPSEASSGGEVQASWDASPVEPTGVSEQVALAAAPEEAPAAPSTAVAARAAVPEPMYAQASRPAPAGAAQPAQVASDAHAGPLLIYEAELHMAVYKVESVQEQAIVAVRELGGYLSEHTDRTRLVLRVPAAQFDKLVARIEALGEVSHRFVRALDVTAQFRDLEMRLRNAEAVRDRLLKLLDKAPDVPQSLKVEQELDRVSERIEQMKGQLKLLSDQLAFSTITIQFSVKRTEVIADDFELPFEWLRTLGLQHLMRLR